MATKKDEAMPTAAVPPTAAAPPTATSAPAGVTAAEATRQPRVKFDTSKLTSSYCNVVNATSTREEVVLNFGLNENWELGSQEVDVHLLHRIIISPFAAERLRELLTKLLSERAARFGPLNQSPT